MVLRKGWLRHLDFITVDMVSIELALAAAYGIVSWQKEFNAFVYWQLFLLLPALYLVSSIMLDAYNGILQRGYLREAGALLKLDFIVFSITIASVSFSELLSFSRSSLMPGAIFFSGSTATFAFTFFRLSGLSLLASCT